MKCPNSICCDGSVSGMDGEPGAFYQSDVPCSVCDGKGTISDPYGITFFPNGMAMVSDKYGNQIGHFNGRATETVKKLTEAGIDWRTMEDVWGKP